MRDRESRRSASTRSGVPGSARVARREARGSEARRPPSATALEKLVERLRSPGVLGAIALVVLALALRLRHLSHGLPDFTEEAIPFRKALEMWNPDGSVDWNPHLFHYPSLTLYLQLAIQKLVYGVGHLFGRYASPADFLLSFQIDPGAMVIAGRLLGVVADLVTLGGVIRIGERVRPGAGLLAGFLVAVAPTLILASRSVFTDTVMTALVVAALERMTAWRAAGGRGRLIATAVLIGLAAGAKYPAIVLLAPLAWVMARRLGARAVLPWLACAGGAVAVFLLTTPYAVLDARAFTRDFLFVSRIGAAGHFGNIDRPGFAFHLEHLREDLGWLGAILLLVSLAWTVARPGRRPDLVTLWIAGLAFGVPIAVAHVLAERYLVPVIPIAALLVATTLTDLVAMAPARTRRVAWPAALALLGVFPLIAGARAAGTGARSTQTVAREWCEANLSKDALIVQELYGATLLPRLESFSVQSRPVFRMASPPMQERFRARRWFGTVTIPLAVVGSPVVSIRSRSGETVELPVFPHVADLNQACYDPRLFGGADYVMTSSQVRGRFAADSARYAVQRRFYALLDSTAEIAARFAPDEGDLGPEITIYRLGEPARAAIATLGPLDPLWWAEHVPEDYRLRAGSLLSGSGTPAGIALRDSSGLPSPWVGSLAEVYKTRYGGFARAMALELIEHRRFAPAERFAKSLLEIDPGDVQACLMFVSSAREQGGWFDARIALERAIAAGSSAGAPSAYLRLEYADVLAHEGEIERARAELEPVLRSGDPYLVAEARRRLERPPFPQSAPR